MKRHFFAPLPIRRRSGRSFLLVLIALLFVKTQVMFSFDGTTPESGKSYYLYNLYQERFLTNGNTWGTMCSVSNSNPLLCTITASGSGYTINTHYGSIDNYIYVPDGVPYVDSSATSSAAQVFNITQSSGNIYNITYDSDGTTMALMFGSGTACSVEQLTSGYNASKAEWMFITEDEYSEYLSKKRFTAAALNVDGMPASITIAGVYNYTLNDNAQGEDGATAIGSKIGSMGYDFVGLSEDFNYHDYIVDALGSGYSFGTHRGKIETSATAFGRIIIQKSPVFDIDGLGFVTRNSTCSFSNESWTAWNTHYGYTSDGADGLIDKGYRFYTVTLADGTKIDVYNLHMDAETSEGDIAARESQLTQLADAIKASSNGNPILIMGDTNCRYTRDRIKTLLIDAINDDSRFTIKDAWIEKARDGIYPTTNGNSIMAADYGFRRGEVVDKIFYINNTESQIRIKAESYLQDLSFVDDSGTALADHWPCVVEFSYHDYDATIDDVAVEESGEYYLCNAEYGYYLKAGSWWGTHAVIGDYGTKMTMTLSSGKYILSSNFGQLYSSGGGPYMDGSDGIYWSLLKSGNNYILYNESIGALSATSTSCNYGPNKYMVEFATLDTSDKKQQWQLLSEEEMLAVVKGGTSSNPVNATHLLPGANFDRMDNVGIEAWGNLPSSATKINYNLGGVVTHNGSGDGGVDNSAEANRVGEFYVQSYSGITTYETTWEMNQSISVPNGKYKVTCQGFYRINTSPSGNENIYLYARSGTNESSVKLNDMFDISQTAISGGTTYNGYYYPNSMSEAAVFFNAGYYPNEVEVEVTDGTLTVAVGKTSASKSSSVWTCFDNFNVYYLGTEHSYQYTDSEERALYMSGTWNNTYIDNEINPIISSSDTKVTSITLTAATLSENISLDTSGNPNILVYASSDNAGYIASPTNNVVVDGSCSSFEITDKKDLAVPTAFTATSASYTRTMTNKWGTIIMPYNLISDDDVQFYTFREAGEDILYFDAVEELAASTPGAFLRSEGNTDIEYVKLSATDAAVVACGGEVSDDKDNWTITGTYDNKKFTKSNGDFSDRNYYGIKDNTFVLANNSLTMPSFRSYFTSSQSSDAKSFGISVGSEDATDIESPESSLAVFGGKGSITFIANKEMNVTLYNLSGIQLGEYSLTPVQSYTVNLPTGVYIVGKKKVVVR